MVNEYPYNHPSYQYIGRCIKDGNAKVKKGASIGANATILCGITIGKYAFIGAGAVVTKDVPDYGLVYGTPAKLKGFVCECGNKLVLENNLFFCPFCDTKYKIISENKIEKE